MNENLVAAIAIKWYNYKLFQKHDVIIKHDYLYVHYGGDMSNPP